MPLIVADGRLVTGLSIAPSATLRVPHGLSHKVSGWLLVAPRGAAPMIFESSRDDSFVVLAAEAGQADTVEFDLWVF